MAESRVVVVTGANGFVGHHVVAALASGGHKVVAVSRQQAPDADIAQAVGLYLSCDLTDLDDTRRLPVESVDAVVNLAGLAAVGQSFEQRDRYLMVNSAVADTVCTVIRERGSRARVVAVSSGAVYAPSAVPLTENAATDRGSSPYAESKLRMEEVVSRHRAGGVDCVTVRPFNHIGPGQGRGFLIPDLAKGIRSAARGGEALQVGNLTTRRDYTDVRDVASAYVALALAPAVDETLYNVCSGRSIAGTEILTMLLSEFGCPDLPTATDPGRMRPSDNPEVTGDSTRIRGELGWSPAFTLQQSIAAYLRADR